MSEFEEYIKLNYPRDYERQKRIYPDQSMEDLYSEDYKIWQHQQAKIDELHRRNQMLSNNIKEQGQKLVYQNEVIETQAEKLLGLGDEKAELQKRVDAALEITKQGIRKQGGDYYLEKLEQALKDGDE